MGEKLWVADEEQFDKYHYGCFSGLLHDLHDFPSNYAKKMLPRRLIRSGKGINRPRRRLYKHDSFEAHKLLGEETSHFIDDQSTRKTSSSSKKSFRARIKALVFEGISKEGGHGKRVSVFPSGPRLQRTYSIHHLEPSGLRDGKLYDVGGHPVIIFHEDATLKSPKELVENNTSPLVERETVTEKPVAQKLMQARVTEQNVSETELKECLDVLEIFKVNKELFPSTSGNRDDWKVSDRRGKFTKSGSFPAARFPHRKTFRPSKLKHKHNERYPISEDNKRSDNQEGNDSDVPLEVIKQIIEDVVREGKEKSNSHRRSSSAYDFNNGKFTHLRRISSLNESTHRYSQLFEYSTSGEAMLNPSRSLKLMSERGVSSVTPIFFGRFNSLPHLDNYGSAHNLDSHDAQFPGRPIRNVFDIGENIKSDGHDDTNIGENIGLSGLAVTTYQQNTGLESTEGIDCLDGMVMRSDVSIAGMDELNEEINDLVTEKCNDKNEYEISMETASSVLPQPCSALAPECCSEEVKSQAEFQVSEGVDGRCQYFEENESAVNSMNISDENAHKSFKNHKHTKLYAEYDDDFDFMQEVLELSGFTTDSFQETMYSPNQPLDPEMFQELESRYAHKPECFEEDLILLLHHLLLFDLVDEVLLQMHVRSCTYYPKPLSYACQIPTLPKGDHLLEQVWKSISKLKPKTNQSLELMAHQDVETDDGWMNLQLESEYVGLGLEELILDELLEEVFC